MRRLGVTRVKTGRTYQLSIIASLAVAGLLAAVALTDLGTTFSPGHPVHVAVQTCGAIVLCFAAFLVFERFHTDARSHAARLAPAPQRLADVVLAPALGLLALTTLLFSAIPAIFAKNPGAFAIWAQTLGQLAGMGAGAAAAWIPTRCNVRRRVTAAQTAGAVAVGLLVVALAALAASRLLETPAYRPSTLQSSWVPTEIILFVLIAVAFVGFARRAERDGDLLMRGLAVAAPFGAGAVITYAIGPALGAGWVIADELFLLGAYAAVLAGAWTESAAYWKRFVQLASAEERRRARSPSATPTPKPSAGSCPPQSARWTSREGLSERSPTRLTSRSLACWAAPSGRSLTARAPRRPCGSMASSSRLPGCVTPCFASRARRRATRRVTAVRRMCSSRCGPATRFA